MAQRPTNPSRQGPGPRLAVIEGWAGRRSAIPFALLVLGVLAAGLIALLSLNTAMGENSVKTQKAQQRQAQLTAREQQLAQQLAGLSAPGSLASAAAGLGLVPNPQPAFLDPSSGAVLGKPSAAPSPSPVPTPTPSPTPSASGTVPAVPGVTPPAPPPGTPGASPGATVTADSVPALTPSQRPSASGSPR